MPSQLTLDSKDLASEMEYTIQSPVTVKLGQPRLGHETVRRELQQRLLEFQSQQESLDTDIGT